MAGEAGGGSGSVLTPKQKLRNQIELWEDLRAGGPENEDRLIATRQRIHDILRDHPALRDEAKKWGFVFNKNTPTGQPQQNGGNGGQGGGGNKGGKNKPGAIEGDLLPGERGKHYRLIRYNGRQYVVYSTKVPGTNRRVQMAWRVQNPERHGFDEKDGNPITRQQFRSLNVFGTSGEITRANGGNKNPFKKFLEEGEARYGGMSIWRNKETFGILMSAFLEKEDPSLTEARLRQTKWWQKRTADQREWEMVLSDKERDIRLRQTEDNMKGFLTEIYGTANWRKHIDQDKVGEWAKNVASGVWDSPDEAMNWWQNRMLRKAEKVEGTKAWVDKSEEQRELRIIRNRPEETFESVRQRAREMLGPRWAPSAGDQSKPDPRTMWWWAKRLSNGQMSQHVFESWLRSRKENLHPYLDPDESWMDRASIYKGQAEQILGRPLSFDDDLFRDFTRRDEEGNPFGEGKVSMTASDFEKAVKNDQRFARSETAINLGSSFADLLGRTLAGA